MATYYETDFDLKSLIAEHGPGTYSIEVWAYDSDSNLIATRKSSPQTFHKLDFEFETLDTAGVVIEGGYGGQLWLAYSFGVGESVNRWSSTTKYFSDCEITVSTMPEKGFVADKLYVDGDEVNEGHSFTLDSGSTIKAVFKQDLSRVPATITPLIFISIRSLAISLRATPRSR